MTDDLKQDMAACMAMNLLRRLCDSFREEQLPYLYQQAYQVSFSGLAAFEIYRAPVGVKLEPSNN